MAEKAWATKSGEIFRKQIFIFQRNKKPEKSRAKHFSLGFCVLAFLHVLQRKVLFLPLNEEKSELLNEILL